MVGCETALFLAQQGKRAVVVEMTDQVVTDLNPVSRMSLLELLDKQGVVIPGLYATGWIKRGPTGIIGTNRADSVATVTSLLADVPNIPVGMKCGAAGVTPLLQRRGVRVVSYEDWGKIDAAELRRGESAGKPREKFTRVTEMLQVLGQSPGGIARSRSDDTEVLL